jgi:hypothetical protein
MISSKFKKINTTLLLSAIPVASMFVCGTHANAAESWKLRQSPIGSFGGDIFAPAEKPGFFGGVSIATPTITGVKGPTGDTVTIASGVTNVPLGALNPALAPYNAYKASVAEGAVGLNQDQTQINLGGGYITEGTYADGKLLFAANVPFIKATRIGSLVFPSATFSGPAGPAQLPATITGPINASVQAGAEARAKLASGSTEGLGDTELSTVWIKNTDRLRVTAGVSLFVPTGKFDPVRQANLQANTGFGDFYTVRPGATFAYNLDPKERITVAGRVAYGFNTVNKDTQYKSGNFVYAEGAIAKVIGDVAFGLNVFSIQQISDDSYSGTDKKIVINGRYKTMGGGPFISYKLPGQDMALNFQISNNFQGENAIVVKSYQLRLIRAF